VLYLLSSIKEQALFQELKIQGSMQRSLLVVHWLMMMICIITNGNLIALCMDGCSRQVSFW
jgi:hypothetical protein